MDIPQPLPWEQRVKGASPMPGGYAGYLGSLREICERVEQGSASFEELVRWTCVHFGISETSARLRLGFLRNAGIIRLIDGRVSVDDRILRWVRDGGDHIPIAVIHSRIRFVGEMLSELQEPKSAEALRKAAARYGLDWQTLTQIDNRRGWLQSAKLIEGANDRLMLTTAGMDLVNRLNVHEPKETTNVSLWPAAESQQGEQSKPPAQESIGFIDADSLAEQIVVASTASADPSRFEQLVRDAFGLMGFLAEHLGGPGSTDVLLTAPLGMGDSYRVAVDAKTTASGSLKDNQVDWTTLEEHRDKHHAEYSLLVAPSPSGKRLMSRARKSSVAVLSAEQLADLCRRHARAPLSLVEYRKLFETNGEVDLTVIDEPAEHLASLLGLVSALCGDLSEKTDRFGRMSARDIQLAFSEEANGISQEEIQRLLDMLAHPLIGVVYGFGNDEQGGPNTDYVLGTSRDVCLQRFRILADQVEKAKR